MKLVKKVKSVKRIILRFCALLGFDDYDTFKAELLRSHMIRLDQIRARMLGVNSEQLIDEMENLVRMK